MKENVACTKEEAEKSSYGNSKVWLILQEAPGLGDRYNLPVSKELLFEYFNHTEISENGVSPVMLPVGYVIEHPQDDAHTNSWREYDKGFSIPTYIHGYPIVSGVEISHLEGELLTIIDASFPNKEQRESIKSLIRNTVWKFNSNGEEKIEAMFKSLK